MAAHISPKSFPRLLRFPLFDFLAPRFAPRGEMVSARRGFVSPVSNGIGSVSPAKRGLQQSQPLPNHESEDREHDAVGKALTRKQRDFLSKALRVNQAGELAATKIYIAQTPPIVSAHPNLRPTMKHMYDQELGHFKIFNRLLAKHRIRPTAMYPIWSAVSTGLGWATGVLGREAAMACTEAVETEIGDHYNRQVGDLLEMAEQMGREGQVLGQDLTELIETIRRIRDEELDHLDHAVENDAKEAKSYELLTGVIRSGCRTAIWITERV